MLFTYLPMLVRLSRVPVEVFLQSGAQLRYADCLLFHNVVITCLFQHMKSSKKDAKTLALRCFEILNEVAAPVMNQSDLSPAVKQKLSKFTDLLNDIKISLDSIQGQKWSRRFKHLNRNQDLLRDYEKRLNEAYQDLSFVVALQTHLTVESRSKQSVVEFQQTNTALRQIY
ncbi:hypothetical protein H0H87_000406, partial [Tephrocybe sp. NHM501043]